MPHKVCCNSTSTLAWLKFTASIIQLLLTVAILVLVRYQLEGMGVIKVDGVMTYTDICYLSPPDGWPAACTYVDVVSSVSMLLTFVISVLQLYITSASSRSNSNSSPPNRDSSSSCVKCPQHAQLMQLVLLLLGLVWWLSAACTLQYFGATADAAGMPKAPQRTVVTACCWLSVGLFALLVASELCLRLRQRVSHQVGVPVAYPASFVTTAQGSLTPGCPPYATSRHSIGAVFGPSLVAPMQPVLSAQQQQQGLVLASPPPAAGVAIGIPVMQGVPGQLQRTRTPTAAPPNYGTQSGMGAGAYQLAVLSGGAYNQLGDFMNNRLQQDASIGHLGPRRHRSTGAVTGTAGAVVTGPAVSVVHRMSS